MIRYSARAAVALGFLKRQYNDVEIFVEDTASPNMWIRLLERVMPPGLRLKSVNLLGGRDKVLEACRLDQADDGRRKLYIIDGDFDFLIGRGLNRIKFLHRMPSYCVENLLTSASTVADTAFSCCTKTTHDVLEGKLTNLFGGLEALVRKLFVVYATCEKLGAGLKTVSVGVHPLLIKVNGVNYLDENKLRKRIYDLCRRAMRLTGVANFSIARKKIQAREQRLPLQKVVSGKDFIFPLIWIKLKELKDFSVNLDHFKVHLAAAFDPSLDPLLFKKMRGMT